MPAVFVTGTGTDIGKTYVACGLVRALRAENLAVDAFKPVVSGFDEDDWGGSDPGLLLDALERPRSAEALATLAPWRFKAPLSPDQAARLEGREVDFDDLVETCRERIWDADPGVLLIEGAGGVMSPITARATNLDLMAALKIPVILVGGSYLGAISHTLTALEALGGRGLDVRLLLINESVDAPPLNDMAGSLASFAHAGLMRMVVQRGERFEGRSKALARLFK